MEENKVKTSNIDLEHFTLQIMYYCCVYDKNSVKKTLFLTRDKSNFQTIFFL